MPDKNKKTFDQRLIHAYEQMLKHIKTLHLKHRLTDAIKEAEHVLLNIGTFTHEEVELTAKYVTRDLTDMGGFLHDTEEDLVDWLLFDVELIEDRLWESFVSIADQTLLDRQALTFRLERGPMYKIGEVTAIGSLQCDNCGQIMHFHKISHIPPCPKCHGSEFSRIHGRRQK